MKPDRKTATATAIQHCEQRPYDTFPRLSSKEALILNMLVTKGEMYGLEMVETANGELKRGTVYVTLNRMEEKGYIDSRLAEQPSSEGGSPRRLYRPTGYGARVFSALELAGMRLAES
ncbi:MAG TPA: PadR family transcriptional regulator [Thermoanaerobaculia bacterium]|nr:PadR family transcriptional regulator [Thermoanaerobaculia bacterium]